MPHVAYCERCHASSPCQRFYCPTCHEVTCGKPDGHIRKHRRYEGKCPGGTADTAKDVAP